MNPLAELQSRRPRPQRFLLTVDDAGEFLVSTGDGHLAGHPRGGRADLPLLADVGVEHARFLLGESLRDGGRWRVEPFGAERVAVNGEPVSTSADLRDGDLVGLGANLELRFRRPDPASTCAVLDLLHGVECLGAAHVILFGCGLGSRLRIGAAAGRHIRVPGLVTGLELVHDEDRLLVSSEAGVSGPGVRGARVLTLPFPPARRVDLAVGVAAEGRPPCGLSLLPVPGPGGRVEASGGSGG